MKREQLSPDLLLALLGKGKSRACHGRDLARNLGIDEREVRSLVEFLRRQGQLIGSTPQQGGGYYLIESVGELEDTARHLVSRARRMFTTLSAMRASAARVFGPEQERLFEVQM